MALTISNKSYDITSVKRLTYCDIAFDSSYAFGGESLTPSSVGLTRIERAIFANQSGFTFEYDVTNQKVKVFAPAPPIVHNELVTVTSNVGTLKYPAAYIMHVSYGNAAYKVIPGGLTPVTTTVSVSEPAWGVRNTLTFLSTDSVTYVYVTYITQAWKEVFDNYVLATLTAGARVGGHADLTFTAGTPDTLDLGEYAVAIQSVMWNDAGTYKACKACYAGVDPATTEVAIDFTNSSSSETRVSFREEDTVDTALDTVYVQYIKKPTSGFLYDRFVEEDDLTPSSDVVTCSSGHLSGSNMLLYGSCGDMPGPTGAYANIISSLEAVGTTATLIQPTTLNSATNTMTLGSNHADSDHVKPSYLVGWPYEIPGLVPLEVANAFNLEDITGIKAIFIGE